MRIYLLSLIMILSYTTLTSQDVELDSENYAEYGLNTTTLISKMIPFGSSDIPCGPFGFSYKKFNNNKGVLLAIGANIDSNQNDFIDNSFLNLALGYEKRSDVGTHWSWYQNYQLILSGGSLNIDQDQQFDPFGGGNDDAYFGIGFGLGGEYRINSHVAVGTEAILLFDFIDDFSLVTIPPLGIFIKFRT